MFSFIALLNFNNTFINQFLLMIDIHYILFSPYISTSVMVSIT